MPDQFDLSLRLEQVASLYSDKIAVRSQNDTLTFRQLNDIASMVAHLLLKNLPPNKQFPIAILLDGSTAIISCIYGILRAGHFYCALSTTEPLEHISKVLTDLGEAVVITEQHILDRMECSVPNECIVLFYSDMVEIQTEMHWASSAPDSLAGIFYTSGSTGAPKGTLRCHRDMQYLTRNFGTQLGFRDDDRILAMRPFGSTSSAVDVFGGLLTGASLVTYDFKSGGVSELVAVLKSEEITIFRPPVQVMRTFMDLLPEGEFFSKIRLFFATGDVLYKKDVERIRKIIALNAIIVHQLASSEAGLLTVNKIKHATPLDDDIIPVGYPLPEQEILILDEQGGIITDYQPGEIGVRGDFVFPGYWRHPEWTADMFTPDPRDSQKKIMRTGDLGRFRPDGQLEFMGRNDTRVKIKGFSIDLNAIDTALQKIPGVQRSVTVVQANQSEEKRLVAYIQPVKEHVLAPSDLRKNLLRILPDYMVPYLFVLINEFPLTFAGKVNRKALPMPDWEQSQSSAEYVPPRDEIEKELVLIWQKAFDIDRVGVQDDFFELGGDSLLASALFVEIELVFKRHFPLSILLAHGTISAFAEILRIEHASKTDHLVALRAAGSKPPLFLVPGGGSDTITFIDLVEALGQDQPVYGLEDLFVGTSSSIYANGIQHAADEFIKDMKKIQPNGPYYIGGHSFGGMVAFEIACQLHGMGETVGMLAILDTNPPVKENRVGPLQNRLQTHKSNLDGKSPREVAQYILDRFKRRFSKLGRNKWVQKIYAIKLVEHLLWFDNRRYVQMARGGYKSGIYAGDAIIYRASEKPLSVTWDMTAAWPKFITGKVEYHDVPGLHNYIIKNPNAKYLARLMTKHLERAFSLYENEAGSRSGNVFAVRL